jgi:flavorubredoxin
MANAIAEGARSVQGVEVELKYHATPKELATFEAIIIGVPTYHNDMTIGIKHLLEEAAVRNISLKDRIGAAFGSYGWSGVAPRLVLEIMKNKFVMRVIEPPLLLKYTPDHAGLEQCREFGRNIAEKCKPLN